MIKLYIDVDGVLLSPHIRDRNGPSGFKIKDYVDQFIPWAVANYDCYWLTAWATSSPSPLLTKGLLPYLPPEAGKITIAPYGSYKTDAIKDGNFIWIDDNLLPDEEEYLKEHGWLNNFIHVNPREESIEPVAKQIAALTSRI